MIEINDVRYNITAFEATVSGHDNDFRDEQKRIGYMMVNYTRNKGQRRNRSVFLEEKKRIQEIIKRNKAKKKREATKNGK